MRRWPSVGPNTILVPCLRECDCGATWYGEPDEKLIGLYWWSLFRTPGQLAVHEQDVVGSAEDVNLSLT